jgi:hypothetical protein
MFLGSKVWLVSRADNHTAILNISQPYRPPRSVMGIALLFFFLRLLFINTAGGIRHADHVAPSIRTSWQSLRRQAAVARSV